MILLACVFALVGLVGLAFGGDWLVEGATGLARRLRVSSLVIGMTVVAYGTSAPEIGASVMAALRDSPGLAVGNVIGSNAANLGLALGLTALIRPFPVARSLMRREFVFLLVVTALLWPLTMTGVVSRPVGFGFVAILVIFNVLSIRWGRSAEDAPAEDAPDEEPRATLGQALGRTLLGLVVLLLGADLLVRGATQIAAALGVSETTIGFTLVALGTSLPEIATSVAATRRGEIEIVAGNVIGSNLFNVLGALGLASIAAPIALEPELLRAEVPGVVLLTLFAGLLMLRKDGVGRREGILLLVLYAGYAGYVLA